MSSSMSVRYVLKGKYLDGVMTENAHGCNVRVGVFVQQQQGMKKQALRRNCTLNREEKANKYKIQLVTVGRG